jgi:hypothetical protein
MKSKNQYKNKEKNKERFVKMRPWKFDTREKSKLPKALHSSPNTFIPPFV